MDVLEVKHTLLGERRAYRCRGVVVGPTRATLLYVLPRGGQVADLALPAGTVTVAHYWADRPYNVYHWISPVGETLAYYFNLSGPVRITRDRVEWEDLEVDVLVTPDRRVRVLDEDRVPGSAADRAEEIDAARRRVLDEWEAVVREVEALSRAALAHGPVPGEGSEGQA